MTSILFIETESIEFVSSSLDVDKLIPHLAVMVDRVGFPQVLWPLVLVVLIHLYFQDANGQCTV